MKDKPRECTCSYPKVVFRNGSGHAETCPEHKKWLRRFKREVKK